MKTTILVLLWGFSAGLVPSASAQQPRLASLAQQKMCADQARTAFNESDASKPIQFTGMRRVSPAEYTSHFDPKANVCYIMVRETTMITDKDDKTLSTSILVYDAFEGRVYANYLWMNNLKQGKKYWEVRPSECSVKSLGEGEVACTSQEEFESLVDKHFGIGL